MHVDILKRCIELEALCSSESQDGAFYKVECHDGDWSCTCPAFVKKQSPAYCKHILAVKKEIK